LKLGTFAEPFGAIARRRFCRDSDRWLVQSGKSAVANIREVWAVATRRSPYTNHVFVAFAFQLLFLVFYILGLDNGRHLRAFAAFSLAFWLGAIVIMVRRPNNPTRFDLLYVRWGLAPFAVFVAMLP
jgi:hypothetical protein